MAPSCGIPTRSSSSVSGAKVGIFSLTLWSRTLRSITTSTYQEERPWNYTWKTIVEDTPWWRENLEEPCLLVLARAANLASMVGNDAPIEAGDDGHSPLRKRPRTMPSASGSRPNVMREKHHNVNADGSEFRTNRAGYPLCAGFQTGTCKDKVRGIFCKHQADTVHLCSKCLSADHGSKTGDGCSRVPQPSGKGSSKGGYQSYGGKGQKGKGSKNKSGGY